MPTYTPLQSIELISTASSVTFSNIPQVYKDLYLVYRGTMSAQQSVSLRFNGSSAATYSQTRLSNSGATASSDRGTSLTSIYASSNNVAELSSALISIFDYTNTTTYKSLISRWGNPSNGFVSIIAGLWRGATGTSTEAITSITVTTTTTDTFGVGSTFDLYGISPTAADTAQAMGGTDVFYDSTYVYHVFKGSGTFTPYRNLTADILVVAGGGQGCGSGPGGGGGAGGLLGHTNQSLTANTSYTVTVGAGGGRITTNSAPGISGSNSQFGSLTASVGGGGGGGFDMAAAGGTQSVGNGGSGGGAGMAASPNPNTQSGGTAQSGQGNAGGSGSYNNGANGGGGGGAGAVGGNGTNPGGAGKGGDGSSAYSSWGLATGTGQLSGGTYYYAGGGGGGGDQGNGAGGLGGGGAIVSTSPRPGTTNTGGGGSGGNYLITGGNGGSGIVIVRYAR